MTVPSRTHVNTTFRFFVEKLGDELASVFIGDEGELFYDPNTGIIRLSDGMTPRDCHSDRLINKERKGNFQ